MLYFQLSYFLVERYGEGSNIVSQNNIYVVIIVIFFVVIAVMIIIIITMFCLPPLPQPSWHKDVTF